MLERRAGGHVLGSSGHLPKIKHSSRGHSSMTGSIQVQCQSCRRREELPHSWYTYKGPWRCSSCGATHEVHTNFGSLSSMKLTDRFPPRPFSGPKTIGIDIREALTAFNAFAPRASAVMIRRALERACDDKGAQGHDLAAKIQYLHKTKGLFDRQHVALATATRLFGNMGAHPPDDPLEDLDDDTARRALDLGLYLLEQMYLFSKKM